MLSPPLELLVTSSNSEPQSDISPGVSTSLSLSPSSSPSPHSESNHSSENNQNKKKTVLVFLGSKSKRTRALIQHIAQKRKEKKRSKQQSVSIRERHQSVPNLVNSNMNQSSYDSKQRSYDLNINGNHNPHRISEQIIHKKNKKLPSPYNKKHSEDITATSYRNKHRHKHQKSRSGVLPHSTTNHDQLQITRSLSKSPKPPRNRSMNGAMGSCPYCNTDAPLLQFITASNRHSHLTELRDKLAVIESVANMLKQEISEIQSRSHSSFNGSDSNLHSVGKVSNPFTKSDSHCSNSYLISNITTEQQRALSLLTTQKKLTFPIRGTAMISPQENIGYFDKFKEMRRRFVNQEFFVGLDSEHRTFTVHTKMKSADNAGGGKQYRQIRSFSSLNGAEFESAKDNVLKIWFVNTRGYFLMSFASETEAVTVLNLINIIVNNEEYCVNVANQLMWASYIDKKGKRMRLYSQKFLCLVKLSVKLYKTHINYANGEQPSLNVNLMECDLSRDKKEIKFSTRSSKSTAAKEDSAHTILSIKLTSEIERDDFLNLCAEKLGKAIQKQKEHNALSPSNGSLNIATLTAEKSYSTRTDINSSYYLAERDEDSGTDIEDSEFYDDAPLMVEEKSEYRAYSIGADNSIDQLAIQSMTMSLRGPPLIQSINTKQKTASNLNYLEALDNTPRMYGAGAHKALDRLAKKRPSDVDFIETTFKGNEIKLKRSKNTYQLLDVLGKSMIYGAFLNDKLYLHKAVWEQNKVMVINYEKKLEVFNMILDALNDVFQNDENTQIDIDWLKADFKTNSKTLHCLLSECEVKLRNAQSILTDFINKSQQKAANRGAAKLLNKFKDKSRVKVFDNQPYRDLIYKICGHASSLQLYYIYLNKKSNKSTHTLLLNDLRGITVCMAQFGRVVVIDTKEFLFAYLRRGSKNIYQ